MTKKDYELIAAVIASNVSIVDDKAVVSTLEDLAHDFAIALKATNPRFDSDKFVRACGF